MNWVASSLNTTILHHTCFLLGILLEVLLAPWLIYLSTYNKTNAGLSLRRRGVELYAVDLHISGLLSYWFQEEDCCTYWILLYYWILIETFIWNFNDRRIRSDIHVSTVVLIYMMYIYLAVYLSKIRHLLSFDANIHKMFYEWFYFDLCYKYFYMRITLFWHTKI